MKKIIIILSLFLLSYSCYLIYNLTIDDRYYILSLGDNNSTNTCLDKYINLSSHNTDFINKDYRIIDLLNIITYNLELEKNNTQESIHQLLKKADILIISIGMNDIYSKINDNTKEIYTYMNDMINNYEKLLKEISRYDYKEVFILGTYNITNKNNDLFTYLNYKLRLVTNNFNYTYIDLNKTLYNNKEYLKNNNTFILNNEGYNKICKIIVEKTKKY